MLGRIMRKIRQGGEQVSSLRVEEIDIEVIRKAVKHLRLAVLPPDGRVRLTAPRGMDRSALRQAVVDRLEWIRGHRERLQALERQTPRTMADGESVWWLGQPYRLCLKPAKGTGKVRQDRPGVIDLYAKADSTAEQREAILYEWYREHLKRMLPPLLAKWEPVVGVQAAEWGVKRMKTRWGSCNVADKRLWFNLELARKPVGCIEYVVVHELVHLLEASHNARFKSLMGGFLPNWNERRAELNAAPLSTDDWEC